MAMKHNIQHDLPPDKLREAVRNFSSTYCERFKEYQAQTQWLNEDTLEVRFNVKGIKLGGTLHLQPREIGVEMEVPLALRLFKGRAIKAIEEEVRPWLDKAKQS